MKTSSLQSAKLSNDAGRGGGAEDSGSRTEETEKLTSIHAFFVSGVTLVKRRASLTAAHAHLNLCEGKKTKLLLEMI